PKARLASISTDVDVVSASTIWTPTLTPASSDVDANFSDLHALQSLEFREQASSPIGELSPMIQEIGASSDHLQQLGDSWSIREGFPDLSLVSTSVRNPEEGVIGDFLGLPKESFTAILDPLVVFFRGKQELGVNALDTEIPGVVGDDTLAEETVETDSERGDQIVGVPSMASRGRRGGAPAREDEPRRDERAEQQAPAPQGPVLPPPPPVDYGVFMQGLVQAMQTQAHTQAALQAQLEAQERANVSWASLLSTRFEDGAIDVSWDEFVRLFRAKFVPSMCKIGWSRNSYLWLKAP
ncbi:hypothetical protein Taro_037459, partial [Colocasia esculenta]|nr:hypothetical protein [Colocasia esculenta]